MKQSKIVGIIILSPCQFSFNSNVITLRVQINPFNRMNYIQNHNERSLFKKGNGIHYYKETAAPVTPQLVIVGVYMTHSSLLL